MKKLVVVFVIMFSVFAKANNSEPVDVILASYKIEKVNYGSVNPLCVSIYKNDIEMVKKLIQLGADVNEFSGGKSPLMYAARFNNVEMIKLLVANGANLKAKDKHGRTALDYAKLSKANEALTLLKELKK